MNTDGATGYGRLTLDELLDLVEHKEYSDGEGFWLAKELRQKIDDAIRAEVNEDRRHAAK